MARRRKRRKIHVMRLLGTVLFLFLAVLIVIGAVMRFSTRVETPPESTVEAAAEPTPDPVYKHPYSYSSFTLTDGVLSYEDEKYTSLLGIDVSTHQDWIDWQAVAADGVEFAMIRAGYRGFETGELHEDELFHYNMEQAHAYGIRTGVYFFSQAVTPEEAEEEAAFVLGLMAEHTVNGPVAFDMELTSDHDRINDMDRRGKTDAALAFVKTIRSAGYVPMIYGSASWLMDDYYMEDLQDECAFWVASYDSKKLPYSYVFEIWQYTNKGSVPGIGTDVDLNIQMIPRD